MERVCWVSYSRGYLPLESQPSHRIAQMTHQWIAYEPEHHIHITFTTLWILKKFCGVFFKVVIFSLWTEIFHFIECQHSTHHVKNLDDTATEGRHAFLNGLQLVIVWFFMEICQNLKKIKNQNFWDWKRRPKQSVACEIWVRCPNYLLNLRIYAKKTDPSSMGCWWAPFKVRASFFKINFHMFIAHHINHAQHIY